MKVDRETLLATIKKVDAALVKRDDPIPIRNCVCFGPNDIHAFDDVCAMIFPAKFGIQGGIRGELLQGFLSQSRAKEVEFIQKDEKLTIKAGRASLDTPLLPVADFLFEAPDIQKGIDIRVDTDFLAGLSKAALSMGRDAAQLYRFGITLISKGKGYTLFSTTDAALTRVIVGDTKGESKAAVLLPPRFVDLLLATAKSDTPTKMTMAQEWGLVTFQSGLRLFTKTVAPAEPDKYLELLAAIDAKATEKVDIPPGFDRCLGRAELVIKFARDPHCKLSAGGGKLKLETQSDAGDIRDSLPFEHSDISVFVPPGLITAGLSNAKKMCVLPECVRLSAPGYCYLICTHNVAGPVEAVAAVETEAA